jgi:ankyrin repeat protein
MSVQVYRIIYRDNHILHLVVHVAAKNSQISMLQLLLKKGADINARDSGGRTALIECARWNQDKVAQFLLENGADASIAYDDGITALVLSEKMDGSVARVIRNFKK